MACCRSIYHRLCDTQQRELTIPGFMCKTLECPKCPALTHTRCLQASQSLAPPHDMCGGTCCVVAQEPLQLMVATAHQYSGTLAADDLVWPWPAEHLLACSCSAA